MPLFDKADPLDKVTASVIRLPKRLWSRLERIAEAESKYTGRYVSRNDVIERMLDLQATAWERAQR